MLCSHGSRATHEFASSYFGISGRRTTIPCHLPPMASRTPSLSAAVPHKRFPGILFSRHAWKRRKTFGGYKKAKTKLENHYRCKIERAIFKGWWQHTTCIQSSLPIRWVQFVAQHFFSLVALAGPLVRLPNLLASTAWSLQNRSEHK